MCPVIPRRNLSPKKCLLAKTKRWRHLYKKKCTYQPNQKWLINNDGLLAWLINNDGLLAWHLENMANKY